MRIRAQRLRFLILGALALLLAGGCGAPAAGPAAGPATGPDAEPRAGQAATLYVFAAASLTDAFGAIGDQFMAANPGVAIVFNFGGSNQLATQIGEGAPADLFAAANSAQMEAAIATGRIAAGAPQTFARNLLVVVMPGDNPAGLETLQDLARPGVKIVFGSQAVPAGRYALDFLDKAEADGSLGAGYREAVLANVVSYEENVRSVLTKVALGEADAGIVYASDVAGSAAGEIEQIEIPDSLNSIASYPIAVLSDSPQPQWAQAFVEAVLSAEGQQVLADFGLIGSEE